MRAFLGSVVLLVVVVGSWGSVMAHEPGEHCCVYHEARKGALKSSPRRAGGDVTADTPGAIPCVGLAARTPGAPLEPYAFFHAPLGEYDVLIDLLYCGICHSDIHAIDGEFGRPGDLRHFPYVAGHEAVGRVRAVGGKVTQCKVGDVVGLGCYKGFCGHCAACADHEEQYCPEGMLSYDFGGGMATCSVVPEDYAFPIPAEIPPEKAGPLLCAGVTAYSAVNQCQVKPGMACAVVGFGGLGHMAARFIKEKGALVTVFDVNTDKAAAAEKMGLVFVDASDASQRRAMAERFDVVIDTVPGAHDPNTYIRMLKRHGRMHFLGLPNEPLPVATQLLLIRNRTLTGSAVGSIDETVETLRFCAEHQIFPEVEVIRADQANEAIAKLRSNTGGFRYVIDLSTLEAKP